MSTRQPRAFLAVLGVVALWLIIGGVTGPLSAKLTGVQKNDNASYLPASAESTKALELQKKFQRQDVLPAIIVYERRNGTTPADTAKASADAGAIAGLTGIVGRPQGPIPSADGQALQVIAIVEAKDFAKIPDDVKAIRDVVKRDLPSGLGAKVTGPGGLSADFAEVFGSIDTKLLLVTFSVVALILLIVYRSVVLWLVPLMAAALAYTLAQGMVYLLAVHAGLTVNGQSQGILTVLVFGAGTDYALLLISRYREELHRHESKYDAMRRALRGAAPAILASAATVIVGLLCLLFSELNSNKSLGPVGAVGIACALLVMLTFLPAVLLFGRWVFWPFVPRYDAAAGQPKGGLWVRISNLVGRRPRAAWVSVGLVLVVMAAFSVGLKAEGLSTNDSLTKRTEAVVGQEILARHYPSGSGSPEAIIANADRLDAVVAAAKGTEGVAAVAPFGTGGPGSAPKVVDGLVEIDAVLAADPSSPKADVIVQRLRQQVHQVPGADAVVGGFTSSNLDVQLASQRDRKVIIPIVLLVILFILAVLLRSLLAPLLLIGTVILSFFATLGVCSLVFTHIFGFAGADSSFPLFVFVFLVALGIDYNIFLMTRVREESLGHGTRAGILRGLAVTGGVITSAGIVLAATFSVLGVLPLVFLTELGFAVAFGVLMDTMLVRSILVPALSYEIGPRIWWPNRRSSRADLAS
ncbi:MAG: MMPL family transporter [Mycobacteriales bacterium]